MYPAKSNPLFLSASSHQQQQQQQQQRKTAITESFTKPLLPSMSPNHHPFDHACEEKYSRLRQRLDEVLEDNTRLVTLLDDAQIELKRLQTDRQALIEQLHSFGNNSAKHSDVLSPPLAISAKTHRSLIQLPDPILDGRSVRNHSESPVPNTTQTFVSGPSPGQMAPSSRVSLDILLISKEPKYASGFKHDSVDGDSTAFDGHSQDRFIYKKPIGDIGQDMQNRPNTHVRYSDTHNHPILASAPAPAPAPVPAPTSASTSTLAEARLPECPPPFPTHRYNCDNSCNKYHSQHALPSWRQPSLLDQAYKNSSSPPLIHRHTEASGHSRDHGHPTQQNHTYYVANNDVYCAARDSKQQKQQNSDDYSRHRYHHQYTHKPYWQPMQSQQCQSEELGSSSSMSTSHQVLLSKNMTSSCLSSSYDRLSTEQYELSLDYPNTHENGSSVADISIRPPSKRRKRHHNIASKVRSVQPVSRDKDGNYEMPVQVGILTVLCLGSIVWDRDAYHNERYIWPAGYTVQREYYSMKDPDKSVIYTCWITDGGDAPLFHVEAEDMTGEPIVSPTATGAWTSVLRTVNQIRHREHSNSASGPDYFGFSHPTIAKMIQDLPGADRCRSYIMQRFVEMKERHVRGVIKKGRGGRPSMEMLSRGQRALMASSSLPASARDAVAVRSPDSSRSEAGKQMSVEALTNSDCTAVSSTV